MALKQTRMGNDQHDPDSGRFKAKYHGEDFLAALAEFDGGATTSEIAEALDAKYQTAYHHLTQLKEDGRVRVREIGGTFLWIPSGG